MTEILLVISDVDGTLVTSGKTLTEASQAAVARLGAAGIGFSIVSARPPLGLRMLVEPLRLQLPMGAFNGGTLAMPDLTLLEQRLLTGDTARQALAVLRSFAVDIWAFTDDLWLVETPDGAYIAREGQATGMRPTVVERIDRHLESVGKMVGVSSDFERLIAAESMVRRTLADRASVVRSQPYYLDITPSGTDKGLLVGALSRRLGIPTNAIATIGDMENDVAMFRRSGLSIAMGNATPAVKRLADAVTLTNDEDGFAAAVEQLILPRARG
jgi:Cof subfamily protein (haloacid dehalogenase superfamily)